MIHKSRERKRERVRNFFFLSFLSRSHRSSSRHSTTTHATSVVWHVSRQMKAHNARVARTIRNGCTGMWRPSPPPSSRTGAAGGCTFSFRIDDRASYRRSRDQHRILKPHRYLSPATPRSCGEVIPALAEQGPEIYASPKMNPRRISVKVYKSRRIKKRASQQKSLRREIHEI